MGVAGELEAHVGALSLRLVEHVLEEVRLVREDQLSSLVGINFELHAWGGKGPGLVEVVETLGRQARLPLRRE